MKKTKKKARIVSSRYQVNPYALQTRNATGAPPELVPVVVQPRRRRAFSAARQRAKERVTSKEFLVETVATGAGAGAAAVATGWMAGKGWNPWAVGAATAVLGGLGAAFLPGAWKGAGQGAVGWGIGQLASTAMQHHAIAQYKKQQEAQEQQRKALELQQQQQKALDAGSAPKELPAPGKPSNAFLPAISDAFASSRYGRYGRVDDEDRMTDVDLELG